MSLNNVENPVVPLKYCCTKSSNSSNSNHYGRTSTYQNSEPTKIGNLSQAHIKHERKVLVPLPTWFNEHTQCGNCYRSSLTKGADSVERGLQYNNHSTQACHWRDIKRKRKLEYQNQQRSYKANTAIKDPPKSVECSIPESGYNSDDTYRSTTSRKSRRRGNSVASDDWSISHISGIHLHDNLANAHFIPSGDTTFSVPTLDSGANNMFFPCFDSMYMCNYVSLSDSTLLLHSASNHTLLINAYASLGPFKVYIVPKLKTPLISESYLTTNFHILIIRYNTTTWILDSIKYKSSKV